MPENRGNTLTYTNARTHVPLPAADQHGYRATHQPQQPKPDSFDWDWNKTPCTGCQTQTAKPHLLDGLCPTCRGVNSRVTLDTPDPAGLEHSKSGDQVYETLTDADLDTRYHPVTPLPDTDFPQAGKQGQPTTRRSAPRANQASRTPGRAPEAGPATHREKNPPAARETRPAAAGGPDDHVRPENLDIDAATVADAARRASDMLAAFAPDPEPGTPPVADFLQVQLDHTRRTLTRAHRVQEDPVVGMLRNSALTSIAALDLYLERHHPHTQTPAASTYHRAPAPRATPPARPRRRPAPRGDIDEAAVIREYVEDHDSPPVIARRHGCLPKRVRDILDRNNIPRRDDRTGRSGGRNRRTYDQTTIDHVVRLYVDQQQPMDAVEAATSIERRQVKRILVDAGVTIRPDASAAHVAPDDEANRQMLGRYLNGESLHKVGKAFHVRQDHVRALVVAAGHPIRVKGNSAANAQRLRDLGITAAQVKDWAIATGLVDIRPAGLVGRALIDAYEQAHQPGQPEGAAQ